MVLIFSYMRERPGTEPLTDVNTIPEGASVWDVETGTTVGLKGPVAVPKEDLPIVMLGRTSRSV